MFLPDGYSNSSVKREGRNAVPQGLSQFCGPSQTKPYFSKEIYAVKMQTKVH